MIGKQISVVLVAHGYVPDTERGSVWVTYGVYRPFEDPLPTEIPEAYRFYAPSTYDDAASAADRLAALLKWLGYDVTDVGVGDD
jgi:hypothetical protein